MSVEALREVGSRKATAGVAERIEGLFFVCDICMHGLHLREKLPLLTQGGRVHERFYF